MNQRQRRDHTTGQYLSRNTSITRRFLFYMILFAVIFTALSGYYLGFSWERYQDNAANEAIILAQSLESLLYPEQIAELAGGPEDIDNPGYAACKQNLIRLAETTNPIHFAYILRLEGEKIVILMDSESPESPNYSPPGQIYEEADVIYLEPFRTGQAVLSKPVTDRWGTWISVLVPVKDRSSGAVVAVFGIDYSAAEWKARLWQHMALDIIMVISLFFFFLALLRALYQQAALRSLTKKLAYDEALYHNVFTQAPIGIALVKEINFVLESEFGHININPMFEQIIGRKGADLEKVSWPGITHPDDLQADLELFAKFKAGEIDRYSMEKRFLRPDGSSVWTNMRVSHLDGVPDNRSMHLCLIEEITVRKNAEDQLRYAGEHDPWTGLNNRRHLENILRLDAELPLTEKRAIVSINLNTLYLLSLTYGFSYSQAVLKNVADALSAYSNADRQLFSSYEYRFVFYVKAYQDTSELRQFCESLVETLMPITSVERIGGGIGVLELNESNKRDIELILKNVLRTTEKSMKTEEGELSISFFDEDMATQIAREDCISRELVQIAEGQKSERLFLQYQPVLDLGSNRICGFEALARMNSDTYGRVPPNEFIPLTEKTKLIIQLGEVIIVKALQFLKTLAASGYSQISVSINISAVQLMKNGFAGNLIETVNRLQVDPANVGLELTESIFSSNYDEINRILSELTAVGMTVYIDDFGTGYSSLAREHEIRADYLKIDKHFIDKLLVLKPGETITSDIIAMGHRLGHGVIAEGVEYESQLQYLKEHGCDRIQGYLISRPLDEDKAIEHMRQYNQGSER